MKKILAILLSIVLAFSVSVTSFAAETESGEISAAFADFDPADIMNMFAGMDLSAITGALGSLGLGDLSGLLEGFDVSMITDLLGDMNLSGLTDILGGLDIGSLLGGLGGGSDSGDETTTASGDETTTASGDETTTAPLGGNGNNTGNIPQTGSDNGMVAAFAVCAVAAGAFIVLSKKKEA